MSLEIDDKRYKRGNLTASLIDALREKILSAAIILQEKADKINAIREKDPKEAKKVEEMVGNFSAKEKRQMSKRVQNKKK
jgi:hypothetical protein